MGKDIAATKGTAENLEPPGSQSQPAARPWWHNIFPVLTWLRTYQPKWLRADLIAGVTLAAYLMPAGLADASLANLPAEAGLYACLFSGLVFWLFCSSRHTAITVTSAISVLVGASLGDLAGGDASRFWALASCTALIVGGLGFIAWLAKAGVIVNFVSESVLVGFKCGIALFIASTQLPKLFGFKGSHGDFWERAGYFFSHLRETNTASLLLGIGALGLLLLGKRFLKNKPVALFVVIAGIVVAASMDLGNLGVKLLGQVPQGLPPFGLPAVHVSDLNDLLPLALGCFLLGMVETAALGRMFAAKHGYRFDPNQELLGIAGANVMAGLGHGFPVSGGMSQSLVNESGGARTPLSGFIGSLLMLLIVLFLSGVLRYLPQPVLAAIVLMAVLGLFNVAALRHFWRADRAEFVVAVAALLGVLGSGLLRGVLIGAIISVVQLLRRASRPHVAFLGRIPGTRRFSDMARHSDNEPVPGALLVRVESSLLYFNAEHVRDIVAARLRAETTPPKIVILDLSASPHMDIQACGVVMNMADDIKAAGAHLQVVEARSSVRDRLRAEGIDEHVSQVNRFTSVADAVEDFQKNRD
ncbi:MAG: DNA repair protein [Verrucomicrobia bacterium]|nr:MAG: DNA repair protein [Verrucomicrobiota bacterium]